MIALDPSATKAHFKGTLLKKNVLEENGKPCKMRKWQRYYVEMYGCTMNFWEISEIFDKKISLFFSKSSSKMAFLNPHELVDILNIVKSESGNNFTINISNSTFSAIGSYHKKQYVWELQTNGANKFFFSAHSVDNMNEWVDALRSAVGSYVSSCQVQTQHTLLSKYNYFINDPLAKDSFQAMYKLREDFVWSSCNINIFWSDDTSSWQTAIIPADTIIKSSSKLDTIKLSSIKNIYINTGLEMLPSSDFTFAAKLVGIMELCYTKSKKKLQSVINNIDILFKSEREMFHYTSIISKVFGISHLSGNFIRNSMSYSNFNNSQNMNVAQNMPVTSFPSTINANSLSEYNNSNTITDSTAKIDPQSDTNRLSQIAQELSNDHTSTVNKMIANLNIDKKPEKRSGFIGRTMRLSGIFSSRKSSSRNTIFGNSDQVDGELFNSNKPNTKPENNVTDNTANNPVVPQNNISELPENPTENKIFNSFTKIPPLTDQESLDVDTMIENSCKQAFESTLHSVNAQTSNLQNTAVESNSALQQDYESDKESTPLAQILKQNSNPNSSQNLENSAYNYNNNFATGSNEHQRFSGNNQKVSQYTQQANNNWGSANQNFTNQNSFGNVSNINMPANNSNILNKSNANIVQNNSNCYNNTNQTPIENIIYNNNDSSVQNNNQNNNFNENYNSNVSNNFNQNNNPNNSFNGNYNPNLSNNFTQNNNPNVSFNGNYNPNSNNNYTQNPNNLSNINESINFAPNNEQRQLHNNDGMNVNNSQIQRNNNYTDSYNGCMINPDLVPVLLNENTNEVHNYQALPCQNVISETYPDPYSENYNNMYAQPHMYQDLNQIPHNIINSNNVARMSQYDMLNPAYVHMYPQELPNDSFGGIQQDYQFDAQQEINDMPLLEVKAKANIEKRHVGLIGTIASREQLKSEQRYRDSKSLIKGRKVRRTADSGIYSGYYGDGSKNINSWVSGTNPSIPGIVSNNQIAPMVRNSVYIDNSMAPGNAFSMRPNSHIYSQSHSNLYSGVNMAPKYPDYNQLNRSKFIDDNDSLALSISKRHSVANFVSQNYLRESASTQNLGYNVTGNNAKFNGVPNSMYVPNNQILDNNYTAFNRNINSSFVENNTTNISCGQINQNLNDNYLNTLSKNAISAQGSPLKQNTKIGNSAVFDQKVNSDIRQNNEIKTNLKNSKKNNNLNASKNNLKESIENDTSSTSDRIQEKSTITENTLKQNKIMKKELEFSYSSSIKITEAQIFEEFIEKCIESKPYSQTSSHAFYSGYSNFCRQKGFKTEEQVSYDVFIDMMQSTDWNIKNDANGGYLVNHLVVV
ncbi:hypothetical protein BB561_003376 [Smittium simulii]|uniref:PH domain-containing protein n=1 Tax=Smittium simulii TaxID=133385 RepID=A0A2T9YLS6_9FUNG|nr:hypothetical protein BB561_003376 [Smittium simulii]